MDLDNDGYTDILTGSYSPGKVNWIRGSEKGFLPLSEVEQEGYGSKITSIYGQWDCRNRDYWGFSACSFADFNNDGLIDLFVGGPAFRVALNIGTKSNPKFGTRTYLYHVNGEILHINRPSDERIKECRDRLEYPNMAGVYKSYMTPTDWDNDGVLDLLVTTSYSAEGSDVLYFFRGVNTDKGLRFEEKKTLMAAADGSKLMPGCSPMVRVVDYNNDGIDDLLCGISIPTINGYEIAEDIIYRWNSETDIYDPGKDLGLRLKFYGGTIDSLKIYIAEGKVKWNPEKMVGKLKDIKYLSLRHRGYAFVILGNKNRKKAKAITVKAQEAEENVNIPQDKDMSNSDGVVSYSITTPKRVTYMTQEFEVKVELKVPKGNYFYSNTKSNIDLGCIPTNISFEINNENIETVGDITLPDEHQHGAYIVYEGDNIVFSQKYKVTDFSKLLGTLSDSETFDVKVKIEYQTCNSESCSPPNDVTEIVKINKR